MFSKKRAFVLFSVLVVLSMISMGAAPAQPSRAEVKNPDTFIVAHYGEPESLDPAYTYETTGSAIEYNLYDGLIAFNREKADEFVPALAEKWALSSDGLNYTFNVRKGVKFHSGDELTPGDVAYSFQRSMLQDRVDGPQTLLLDPILGVTTILDKVNEVGKLGYEDASTIDLTGGAAITGTAPVTSTAAATPDAIKKAAEDTCKLLQQAVSADDAAGTVTLKLSKPAPWFLQVLAQSFGAVVSRAWQAKQGDWDGDCATWPKWHNPAADKSVLFNKANGTGPYKLDHWTPGEEIVLVANDDYWRKEPAWTGGPSGAPSIKRVVLKLVEEWGTRFSMFQARDADYGDVDAAFYPQADTLVKTIFKGVDDQAPSVAGATDGVLNVYRDLLSPEMTGAMFNFAINTEGGNPFIGSGKLDGSGIPADFFSDIHVRKAFEYCYDWDAHIKEALQGEAIQPKGPILKGMLGYDDAQATYAHDLDKCKTEFQAAWSGKVWDTGFDLQLVYNTGNDLRRIAAEIIKKNVESISPKFKVTVQNLPWASFLEVRTSGKLPILISGWLEDYHDPSNWVQPFMDPVSGSYARAQHLPKDLADKFADLIQQGVSSVDPKVREPIYKNLQSLAYENAITIFLYEPLRRRYFQDWIHGWYFNPLHPEPYANIYALKKG
jgi:peptide/nickel transport system substrate-binding protein